MRSKKPCDPSNPSTHLFQYQRVSRKGKRIGNGVAEVRRSAASFRCVACDYMLRVYIPESMSNPTIMCAPNGAPIIN